MSTVSEGNTSASLNLSHTTGESSSATPDRNQILVTERTQIGTVRYPRAKRDLSASNMSVGGCNDTGVIIPRSASNRSVGGDNSGDAYKTRHKGEPRTSPVEPSTRSPQSQKPSKYIKSTNTGTPRVGASGSIGPAPLLSCDQNNSQHHKPGRCYLSYPDETPSTAALLCAWHRVWKWSASACRYCLSLR